MSQLSQDTFIQALQEAHAAFIQGGWNDCWEKMQAARSANHAIRALGITGDRGRELELPVLGGEKNLASTLPVLRYPVCLLRMYSLTAVQMLTPPSRVFPKEAPLPAALGWCVRFLPGAAGEGGAAGQGADSGGVLVRHAYT